MNTSNREYFFRGGSWSNEARYYRAARRDGFLRPDLGFRLKAKPKPKLRTFCGGSWIDNQYFCRAAARSNLNLLKLDSSLGLRRKAKSKR